MKLIGILLLTVMVLDAKTRYKICITSDAGQGCSKDTFDKKTVFKIRDILVQAPIQADYGVWVKDSKTGASVRGPNDPVIPDLKEPVPMEVPKTNRSTI